MASTVIIFRVKRYQKTFVEVHRLGWCIVLRKTSGGD